MRRKFKKNREESEINITPMLDIVFIMLIFFIVTTSFVKEISIDVNRPAKSPIKEQKKSEVISVRISGEGQIFVQDRLITLDAVRANIESNLALKPQASVVVVSDREADAGFLVKVIDSEINITPMMDIVFIMLIFFIVTTSFIKETGIDPNRPEAETAMRAEQGNILIAISPNDQIWMNKNQIQLESVRILMEAAHAENPESSVVIVADELASTGLVIDIMDQIRLGGISKVSLSAKEK